MMPNAASPAQELYFPLAKAQRWVIALTGVYLALGDKVNFLIKNQTVNIGNTIIL